MAQMHLETFKLGTSMADRLPHLPFVGPGLAHWGLRINGQFYELKVAKGFSPLPRSFTFGPTTPDPARREIHNRYVGLTHYTDTQLREIAQEVETEQNNKPYGWQSIKGYLLPLNNCQTTVTIFWERIRCTEAAHGHAPAKMPISGRQVIAGAVSAGNTTFAVCEESLDNTAEAYWPAIEDFVLAKVHHLDDDVHHLVDGVLHFPDILWGLSANPLLHLLHDQPRPVLIILRGYTSMLLLPFWVLGAEFKAIAAAASSIYSFAPTWVSVPLEAMAMCLSLPTWFGAAFVTIRQGYRLYRNARRLWRTGQFVLGVLTSGELVGLKWRKMLRRLIGSGKPTGTLPDV